MQAVWNGQIVAQSDDTVVVESNHYFSVASINKSFFKESNKTTYCGWKGEAHYYSLVVDGEENTDAAFYYPAPKDAAKEIEGRVAFWRGVVVGEELLVIGCSSVIVVEVVVKGIVLCDFRRIAVAKYL